MQHSMRKLAAAAAVAGGATLALAPSVYAAGAHLSPANTVITANLQSGTTLNFSETVDGFPLNVQCTTATASGKTPAAGLSVTLPQPPTFSGCTDSLGGSDTVVTNQTNAKWKLVANSTGTLFTLKVPKAGATFTSSLVSGCVITVAPAGTASIKGAYDNVNTWTIKGAKFPISGSGCTTSATSAATGTLVFTPNVSVVP